MGTVKDFLQLFLQLSEELIQKRQIVTKAQELSAAKDLYFDFSENEKEMILDVVKSISPEDDEFTIFLESFFLYEFNDIRYGAEILDTISRNSFEIAKKSNYYFQLMRRCFVMGQTLDYEKRLSVLSQMVDSVKTNIPSIPEYTPYSERNSKRILFLITPFLGITHPPSRMIINLAYYYRKLGYEVSIFSTNDVKLAFAQDALWYKTALRNHLYEGMTATTYQCKNMSLDVFHIDLSPDNLLNELAACVAYISNMNPAYIIAAEEANLLAELCSEICDVAYMNMVDTLPVTNAPYIIRYFTEEKKNNYLLADKFEKTVFTVPYSTVIWPSMADQKVFELPEDKFIIVIMGNRLDLEVDNRVIELIDEVLSRYEKIDFAFIGNCNDTVAKLSDYSGRCHFLGYVKECDPVLKKCNLFFNPIRQGGAGGAYMALRAGVPVFTLPNCDVASRVGDEFIYDSYYDIFNLLDRYLSDEDFSRLKTEKALEKFSEIDGVDSIGNIERFALDFVRVLENLEKNRKYND